MYIYIHMYIYVTWKHIYLYIYICIHVYMYIYIHVYIYIPGHPKRRNFLSIRVWTFFLSVTFFFSKYGHVRLPSLYLQVNSFPEILDLSDGFRQYSVSSRDSIWGSMLTFAYCFFQHDVEKILVFFGYIQIWWEIWQYLLPDLGTLWRLPFCSTSGWNSSFGDCRRIWFERPFTIKNPNTQLNKKTYVTGKTHNGQKKLSVRFSRYIYIYIYI